MKPSKILIAYTPQPPILEYLRRAFERAGVEVVVCPANNNWFDRFVIRPINKLAHNLRLLPKSSYFFANHPLTHKNYRSRQMREAILLHEPDLVILVRGIDYHPWAWADAPRAYLWWVEADERLEEAFFELPRFDHLFCINAVGVEQGRARGLSNVSYLPHAVDLDVFRPMPAVQKDLDFSFVGVWSQERERYLKAALDVTRSGAIYGTRWFKRTWQQPQFWGRIRGSYIAGEALVRLYNRSRVVLNISLWGLDGGTARSGLNMRVFEVPACRTALLTDISRETDTAMTPDKEIITFKDIEDFQHKLRELLADVVARDDIAAAGLARVAETATYDSTVQRILAVYESHQPMKNAPDS